MTTDTYFSFCVSTFANATEGMIRQRLCTGEPIRCSLKENYIDHRQQIENILYNSPWLFTSSSQKAPCRGEETSVLQKN